MPTQSPKIEDDAAVQTLEEPRRLEIPTLEVDSLEIAPTMQEPTNVGCYPDNCPPMSDRHCPLTRKDS
ncbi:MAG TPA: hypothetical protein VFS20_27365 [Longimicrobium sp.]|nr:hypothetical protein [Longimicrobium sp.]